MNNRSQKSKVRNWKRANAVFFILLFFCLIFCGGVDLYSQEAKAPAATTYVLPTTANGASATPSSQPSPYAPSAIKAPNTGALSLGSTPAAPNQQPKVPDKPMATGSGSIAAQTEALPLQPSPTVSNPPVAEAERKAKEKQPYVPPELQEKKAPERNLILPPLYGWTRIVLHDLQMPTDAELVKSCGMQKSFIFEFFSRRLQEGGIPIMGEQQAARLVPEDIKVEARPVIVGMEDLVINCTSWVQFQVTAEVTFRVPPLMYRRKMPLLLWSDGMMVTSAKSSHNGALINAFVDLAMRFRKEWDAQQAMVDPTRIVN